MSNAIRVENISKLYRLGNVSAATLKDDVHKLWAKIWGREDPTILMAESNDRTQKGSSNYVWALKGVNFEVRQGEVLGIIGRNGAGKSTLLKILSKVTAPTSGSIKVKGRIASLLEVGTGFHPELTGNENIYLNGHILGMTKREIDNKFDEIVDFAGVEKYLDTPVKRYSSGMYVRLAFAVAAHLEPEILIVDEVLAVGDVEFQKKCLGKMNDVSKNHGRTILFVSHNMSAIRTLCNRAIFMDNGTLKGTGTTESMIQQYLSSEKNEISKKGEISFGPNGYGSAEFKLLRIQLTDANKKTASTFFSNEKIYVEIEYAVLQPITAMRLIVQIQTSEEFVIFEGSSQAIEPRVKNPGIYKCVITIPSGIFNTGEFQLFVHSGIPDVKVLAQGKNFLQFHLEKEFSGGSNLEEKNVGVMAPKLEWQIEKIS